MALKRSITITPTLAHDVSATSGIKSCRLWIVYLLGVAPVDILRYTYEQQ